MKRILLLAAVSWFINAKAIDIKYPVSAIAEDLKKGVDIVVREDHMRFKIKSKSTATNYFN
jgi:hypothetical protein